MRCPALLALAAFALVQGASAEDIAFLDGRVWLDAKVVTREVTYLVVLYQKGVHTVHARELLPASVELLRIRQPTEEEKAEQEKADRVHREAATERLQRSDREEIAARARTADIQAKQAAAPRPAPQVVNEYCSVVFSPRRIGVSSPAITRIQRRVKARVPGGAIVQGDGMPSGQIYGDFCWVVGTCFIDESAQLNATTGGSPVIARVIPAGDYRYMDVRASSMY